MRNQFKAEVDLKCD